MTQVKKYIYELFLIDAKKEQNVPQFTFFLRLAIIMLIFWQKLNKWNVTQVDIMSCAYGLKRVKLLFCPYFGKNKYKLLAK